MKKTLLIPMLLLAIGAQAQVPVNRAMAIVQKSTATWCGPCGSWGWTLQEDIMADNMPAVNPNAFVFTLYGAEATDFFCTAADSLTQWGSSYPNWGVNNINRTAFSSTGGIYTTTTRTEVKRIVDSFAAIAPVASTGFAYTITGNTINVTTKTQFWQAASGTYNLAVYVIEDSVYGPQNSFTGNVYHHDVLRGNMGSSVFGDQIAAGTVNANQTFSKNFSFNITNSAWVKGRLKILTVLWKKNGTSMSFVNANSLKSAPTGIAPINAVDQLIVYPNPTSDVIKVTGALTARSDFRISLINALGQTVYAKDHSYATNQLNEEISLDNLSNGVYMLCVNSGGAQTSRRIVVSR